MMIIVAQEQQRDGDSSLQHAKREKQEYENACDNHAKPLLGGEFESQDLKNLYDAVAIHRIICFVQVEEDAVAGFAFEEGQLLGKLGLHDPGAAASLGPKPVEGVVGGDRG